MALAERLAAWMRERVTEAGAQGLVVGLSGGIDSAIVARLSQLAAPGAALGVLMPCHSDASDERDAAAVAKHFSLPTVRVDLANTYDSLTASVKAEPPAVALLGDSDVSVGTGLLTVKFKSGVDVPPPGLGFETLTATLLAFNISAASMVAVTQLLVQLNARLASGLVTWVTRPTGS